MNKATKLSEMQRINEQCQFKTIYEVAIKDIIGSTRAYYILPGGYRDIEANLADKTSESIYFSDMYGNAHAVFKRNLLNMDIMALSQDKIDKIINEFR